MTQLTITQQAVLHFMSGYRVVAQFISGAVLVVYEKRYQETSVIDTDGHVYSLSRYLAILEMRPKRQLSSDASARL